MNIFIKLLMILGDFMPITPASFSQQGNVHVEDVSVNDFMNETLVAVNDQLKERNLQLRFSDILSGGNYLLVLKEKDCPERPIDIIDPKALDETSLKSKEELVTEIINKIDQHLLAEKTEGIFISSSGSKFDVRNLKDHHFDIDPEGYIRIDGYRICVNRGENRYIILKAEQLRSYTIHRLVKEGEGVRSFDDYDVVRLNGGGMFIDTTKTIKIDQENFFPLLRDSLTPELRDNLRNWFAHYSAP